MRWRDVNVYPGGSIQYVVDAAWEKDTIYRHAGTHVETVMIELAKRGVGRHMKEVLMVRSEVDWVY